MADCSRAQLNDLTYKIIAAAIEVHRHLGPGLLESAYQACMKFELAQRQLALRADVHLPLAYKEVKLDCGYRIDLWVEGTVIVELKTVESIAPVHQAQLLTYLKLTGAPAGLLINFKVPVLRQGIKRMLNQAMG